MSERARWIIGAGETQKFVAEVMEHSIKEHSSIDVDVIHTYDKPRPTWKGYPNPPDYSSGDPTPFSFVRIWAPELCGYEGRVIVTDCDMLVFGDARELWETDMGECCAMQARCTAVLLLNCERCQHWSASEAIDRMKKSEWSYSDAIQHLCKTPPEHKGRLDENWNSYEQFTEGKTKLLHYTRRLTQPWDFPGKNKLEHVWIDWAIQAIKAGEADPADAERTIALWPKIKAKLDS